MVCPATTGVAWSGVALSGLWYEPRAPLGCTFTPICSACLSPFTSGANGLDPPPSLDVIWFSAPVSWFWPDVIAEVKALMACLAALSSGGGKADGIAFRHATKLAFWSANEDASADSSPFPKADAK